jgi:hypothetical protein
VLGALGHKSFLDPASDTLEIFCGVQQVEATMGALLGALRSALTADDAERCRAALTCALSFGCLTTNINQNILLEFLMLDDFAAAAFGVLLGANAEIDSPALREQVCAYVCVRTRVCARCASLPSPRCRPCMAFRPPRVGLGARALVRAL